MDSVSPAWAAITQGRRRPMGGNENRSMKGPAMSFRPQGRPVIAAKVAISAVATPCSTSQAGNATGDQPDGHTLCEVEEG